MRYAATTHRGLVREKNEDCHKVIKLAGESGQPTVFIVADGMGGHNSGEVASRMTVKFVEEMFAKCGEKAGKRKDLPALVRKAIEYANTKVYEKACTDIEHLGMGTTVTMSMVLGEWIVTGHVGDSRLYHLRDGVIKKITEDHSLIEELVRNGTITRAEACNHPNRNIITKALGCEKKVQVDIYETHVNEGDKILLCTDGLTNMVEEKDIRFIMANEKDPDIACERLVEKAIDNGGIDNITVIVVMI